MQNIKKIEKLVSVEWHSLENSHIGKSACGKYFIEITNEGSHFDYKVRQNEEIIHKNAKPHDSIEDAKRIIMSLLSLKYMF